MKITYLDCDNDEYISDTRKTKYKDYTLDDCALIRTTDVFPFNKTIQTPINGRATAKGRSSIIGQAISTIINKRNLSMDEFAKESEKYYVIYETMRSTIHFCINGLVESHELGNFDSRPFIIIEPLKYHINDKSLINLKAADTYFNEDIQLSEEAAIIIREEEYKKIKNNPEYQSTLKKFNNIFVYRGNNEQQAVKEALEAMNYDNFIINKHGYVNGLNNDTSANAMYNFIDTLRKTFNIKGENHFDSELNYEESQKRIELAIQIDLNHFFYIIENSNLPNELIARINIYYEQDKKDIETGRSNEYKRLKKISEEIVECIGLKKIEELTKEFNNNYINNLKSKKK